MNEQEELAIGLFGWVVFFAFQPLLAVLTAFMGWLFITTWQWVIEEEKERKAMEMYWNEHP